MQQSVREYIRLAIGAILFLIVVALLYWFDVFTWFTPSHIQSFVAGYGPWGPVLFIGWYAGAATVFLPATPLNISAGLLFGAWFGIAYALLGAFLGAIISFGLARFFGRGFVYRMAKSHIKRFSTFEKRLDENALFTIFLLRVIPVFPFFVINYALGLSSISFRKYAIATAIGIIPATTVYAFFGGSLATLHPWQIAFSVLLILILVVLVRWFQRRQSYET